MTEDTVFSLVGRIIAEMPAIGKDQFNEQQRFKFRGIDDVLNALKPLLGKYGVFFAPEVTERLESTRSTSKGGTLYVVNLHVRFTFYGPSGDSFTASGWGEGTDSGDKATNKAMTAAMKYVIGQVFAVASQETAESDADRTTPEPSVPVEVVPDLFKAMVRERVVGLPDGLQQDLKDYFKAKGYKYPLNEEQQSDILDWFADAENPEITEVVPMFSEEPY